MSIIQITPENMRIQASKIRECKTEHENTMTQLNRLIMSLSSDWKGEAQDAFVAKFQSMNYVYKKFEQVLEDYAKLLDKAANEMQNTDQILRNMIQGLS